MKIENAERVKRALDELESLNGAIANWNELDEETGFIITQHIDLSGSHVHYQYKNGSYHPMYKEINKFIKEQLYKAKAELEEEIATL